MSVIYKIVSKSTGKFYLGSTSNFHKRTIRHKRELRKNIHHNVSLQELYNEKGEDDFDYVIVEKLSQDTSREEREQFYLELYDKDDNMLNISKNSTYGDFITKHPNREVIIDNIRNSVIRRYNNMSEEERKQKHGRPGSSNPNWRGGSSVKYCKCGKRIGVYYTTCAKCRDRSGDKNPFYGKKHKPETIAKILANRKYVLPSNALTVEVNGVLYNSLSDAAKHNGCCSATVANRIKRGVEGYKLIKA